MRTRTFLLALALMLSTAIPGGASLSADADLAHPGQVPEVQAVARDRAHLGVVLAAGAARGLGTGFIS